MKTPQFCLLQFGGTSDNGNSAKLFFHPKNRQHVVDLYTFDTEEEKSEFSALLGRFYVILCILSSRDNVVLETFRPYCVETHERLKRLFPWLKDNETVHAVLGGLIHLWKFKLAMFFFR